MIKNKKKILVTTAEKKMRNSYQNGFKSGKAEGRKELIAELRALLGIDELISSKIQSSLWQHEEDKHDTYSGCS